MISAYASDFLNLLDDTYFIVHHNYRSHDSVRSDCLSECLQVNDSVSTDIQISDIKAFIFQMTATVQNAFMLDLGCDDVFLLRILSIELGDTLQS